MYRLVEEPHQEIIFHCLKTCVLFKMARMFSNGPRTLVEFHAVENSIPIFPDEILGIPFLRQDRLRFHFVTMRLSQL